MSIVYSLVARGKTVLADGAPASVTGNYEVVSRLLLTKLAEQNQLLGAQTQSQSQSQNQSEASETEPLKAASKNGGAGAAGAAGRLYKFENGSDFTFYVNVVPAPGTAAR